MGPRWTPSHRSSSRTTSNDARLPQGGRRDPADRVWGWFALVQHDQTPIFVYLNIAVHETGHVLFRPFGEPPMLIMGSGFEVLFLLAVGAHFPARRRNPVAAAVCGDGRRALASAATYIADADDGRLALLGATGPDAAGDWERILGASSSTRCTSPTGIAAKVRVLGFVLWFASLGLAAWAIVRNTRGPATGPRRTAVRPPRPRRSTTSGCGADPARPKRSGWIRCCGIGAEGVGWPRAASSSNGCRFAVRRMLQP